MSFSSIPKKIDLGAFLTIALVMLLIAFLLSPRSILHKEKLELDAASYLAHAFTIGLDFDLDYSNEPYDRTFGYFNERTNLPSHPIGPGLMAAPFVSLFSVVDRLVGNPVIDDHNDYLFSWSRFGFLFSGAFFFLLGLLLYAHVGKSLAPGFQSAWVVVIGFGAGVTYYVYGDGYLGHQFQFFTLALTVWGSTKAWENADEAPHAWTYLSLATLGLVLTHLIRPADLNVVVLPTLVFIILAIVDSNTPEASGRLKSLLMKHLLTLCIGLTILGSVYNALYSTPFPLPQDMYGSTGGVKEVSSIKTEGASKAVGVVEKVLSEIDHVPDVLFSSEFGVLYTSPVMFFGTLALMFIFATRGRQRPVWIISALSLAIIYIGIPGAVVLYWKTTASAYGWRYLLSIVAIGFLAIIVAYRLLSTERHKALRKAAIAILLLFSTIGILSQMFWGTSDKLHFVAGKNVFGVNHASGANCCSGIGYMTKLGEELTSPKAWVAMAAHRFPGFVSAMTLQAAGIDLKTVGQTLGLPADKLEAGLSRYSNVPMQGILQVWLLFIFSVVATWYVISTTPRTANTSSDTINSRTL